MMRGPLGIPVDLAVIWLIAAIVMVLAASLLAETPPLEAMVG